MIIAQPVDTWDKRYNVQVPRWRPYGFDRGCSACLVFSRISSLDRPAYIGSCCKMEQSDTPTPEPKTPESEKDKEATKKTEEDWSFATVCKVCNNDLTNREPKLMPCLHTVCKQCVMNVTTADKQGTYLISCSCHTPYCNVHSHNTGTSSLESRVKRLSQDQMNVCECGYVSFFFNIMVRT